MMKIRRMGCSSRHGPDFQVNRPHGYDCYLLLFLHSPGIFRFDGPEGKKTRLESGTMVLFKPNSPHYYGAAEVPYCNDWIQFEADADFPVHLGLSFSAPVTIPKPELASTLFHLAIKEFYACPRGEDQVLTQLIRTLLHLMDRSARQDTPLAHTHPELLALREDIHSHPQKPWSVALMAQRLKLCQGHFQHLYTQAFGVSCMADVIDSRIHLVRELLSGSLMRTKEVAFACGYSSEAHFCRQFKSRTGLPPLEYRESVSGGIKATPSR